MTDTDTRTTFKVAVRKIRDYTGARGTTYTVRWTLDEQVYPRTFKSFAAADSFRSMLVTALRRGEAFAYITGLPLSHPETVQALTPPVLEKLSVFDVAEKYTAARWRRASGHLRRNMAWTLTLLTTATLPTPTHLTGTELRSAINNWALGNPADRGQAPDDARAIIDWVREHSRPVADLADEQLLLDTLDAVNSKTGDGEPVARSSVQRNKVFISTCLDHAVRLKQLERNPLDGLKNDTTAPRRTGPAPVDKRSLPNRTQARALIAHIRTQPRSGEAVALFFEMLYDAGLRPEEAAGIKVEHFVPPATDGGWGEYLLQGVTTEAGTRWTDTGDRREQRGLKHRDAGEIRPVPVRPSLARRTAEYLAANKREPGDYILRGEQGGQLCRATYCRALHRARTAVLTPEEAASPLARRPYDCRHACATNMLNAGLNPADVARILGNSVPVLLATYIGCIAGGAAEIQKKLEAMHETD
jgi:integrase